MKIITYLQNMDICIYFVIIDEYKLIVSKNILISYISNLIYQKLSRLAVEPINVYVYSHVWYGGFHDIIMTVK